MNIEYMNFNEFYDPNICSNNINWDYMLANEWIDEALRAQKLFEKQDFKEDNSDDNTSLFAEEGSQNGEIKEIKEYLTKETQSSVDASLNGDFIKSKRLNGNFTIEELERLVKREIEQEGFDSVLNF